MSVARRSSIGRKIALAICLPTAVTALVVLTMSWSEAQRAVVDSSAHRASALADLVANAFGLTSSETDAHEAVTAVVRADWLLLKGVRDLRVLDAEGVVRWSRRPEEVDYPFPGAPKVAAVPPEGFFDARERQFAQPLGGVSCGQCHKGDSLRMGIVHLALDEPQLDREVRKVFQAGAVVTVGVFALLAAVSLAATHFFVSRPLRRMTDAMKQAHEGDFMARAIVSAPDELGVFAETFNRMLARITDLKVQEVDRSREMETLQRELGLKEQVEKQARLIEETNRELAERVRELTLLFDITRSLNSTLELAEVLKLITDMVGVTLGFREFSMMLHDEKTGELVIKAAYGPTTSDPAAAVRLKVGEGAAGLAALNKEIVYIEEIEADRRYAKLGGGRDREGSLLCIPMLYKSRLVGVFNFSRPKVNAFSPDEVKLLQSVANQASMAIVNARLFQETVELSLTDVLTGTYNRRYLFRQLEMELQRAERFEAPVAFVMIDVDHFKLFNDASGHPAGDVLLKEAASLLSQNLRKVDTVARYGGEEFAVILPRIRKPEAVEVAEKLRRAVLKHNFKHGEKQPGGRVTISLGVSCYPEDAKALDKIVDSADSALYASKRGGRNLTSAYMPGMEFHPGRERGPYTKKKKTAENVVPDAEKDAAPPTTPRTGEPPAKA